jgi:hypothetical protein
MIQSDPKADGPKYSHTPQKIIGFVRGSTGVRYEALFTVAISQGELDAKSSSGAPHSVHRDAVKSFDSPHRRQIIISGSLRLEFSISGISL